MEGGPIRDESASLVIKRADHLSNPIQNDLVLKEWSKCEARSGNLPYECLTSVRALEDFLCRSIEYQAHIKGTDGTTVKLEHPVKSAGNSEMENIDIDSEPAFNDNIENDNDIPLEVIHIATDYTCENASHVPTCYWRSMRFEGQVSVNYYESDEDELDEVARDIESKKHVEKESSIIWASKHVAACTGRVKVGPAGHLNIKNIVLM
ncbi:hypothetical protein BDD12DRAFT_877107 [Trichophaea hybrida]|nr:hypothetical protein BDD12DRAFT_877107 [Trichophaea hybrida]